MKKNISVLLVAATAIMLVGCEGDNSNKNAPLQEQNKYVENNVDESQSQNHADVDQTKEQRNARIKIGKKVIKADLRKNLVKSFKNIKLCGKKLAYPLTVKSLKKDGFELANEKKKKSQKTADLVWQGKTIGDITLKDKKVVSLLLVGDALQGDDDVSYCGINMQSNLRELVESFGEGSQEGYDTWKYENGKKSVRFKGFNSAKNPRSIQIIY